MKEFLMKLIKDKQSKEKELRVAIKDATDAETVRTLGDELADIQEEIRSAQEQLNSLEKKPEQRTFNPVAAYGATMKTVSNEEAEKRANAFMESGKMQITGNETRSILLSSGSLGKPTEVGGINDSLNTVSSIVDQVKVVDCTGMGEYNVVYQKSIQEASAATDGTAPGGSDPVFRRAAIKPMLIETLTYVSRELKKQTPLQYEEKVKAGAMAALRKKVGEMIVAGNGTTEIYGIVNAVNTEVSPETIYDTIKLESNVIDEKTLRKIVMSYGGDENIGGGAILYLNKTDLVAFGDVRGVDDKKAVYDIIPDGANPNTGIIKDGGLSVPYCINSKITPLTDASSSKKTMIYGAPSNYELGLFGDYEVIADESYKFGEGLITIKGEVMVGGNITTDKGFVVVTV